MVEGVLVSESISLGSKLSGLDLVVTSLARVEITGGAEWQPPVWTLIGFRSDVEPEQLAAALSVVLAPAWYADFHDDQRKWVVYPDGVVFSYARGDADGRSPAAEHGRRLGIPEGQLDWPE